MRNQELDCPGWRLDVAKIFERYVQYVFTDIASVTGAKLHKNFKLNGQFTKQSSWQIKYLEPDAVYQKDMLMVFIDAKYKSHLYNAFHDSEALKEEHRRDLHQILAYASFSHGLHKSAVLCYPSQTFQSKPITYKNPANGSINKIVILGLPMNIGIYKTTKQAIVDILIQLEVETAI